MVWLVMVPVLLSSLQYLQVGELQNLCPLSLIEVPSLEVWWVGKEGVLRPESGLCEVEGIWSGVDIFMTNLSRVC